MSERLKKWIARHIDDVMGCTAEKLERKKSKLRYDIIKRYYKEIHEGNSKFNRANYHKIYQKLKEMKYDDSEKHRKSLMLWMYKHSFGIKPMVEDSAASDNSDNEDNYSFVVSDDAEYESDSSDENENSEEENSEEENSEEENSEEENSEEENSEEENSEEENSEEENSEEENSEEENSEEENSDNQSKKKGKKIVLYISDESEESSEEKKSRKRKRQVSDESEKNRNKDKREKYNDSLEEFSTPVKKNKIQ